MKILCYTDTHFCEKSSIITKYGTSFTTRLENQLQSLNWVERTAEEHGCRLILCLGDFFDHAQLTDQEITALQQIKWALIPHYFLVGNHESEENDLQYSSTMALCGPWREIVDSPLLLKYPKACLYGAEDLELAFLPYTVESNRKAILEYFSPLESQIRLLFSHNDILGLQMGPVVSQTGFSIEELESVSSLCINGHLHNGQQISQRVINLGNLTGKDFSEDATRYTHKILIIDTDEMQCEFIENPYAFNFYKIDIEDPADLEKLKTLKNNAIVSIRCCEQLVPKARELLETLPNITESRVIITRNAAVEATGDELTIADLAVDQCAKFAECCRAKLDNNDILEAELAEILK